MGIWCDAENEFFAVADDVKANDTFQWSEVDDVGVSTINQADLERADNRFSLVFEMAKVAGGLTRATKNVIYVCALEISDGDMKSIWPDSQYLFYVGQASSGIFDRWVGDASSHLRAAAAAVKLVQANVALFDTVLAHLHENSKVYVFVRT